MPTFFGEKKLEIDRSSFSAAAEHASETRSRSSWHTDVRGGAQVLRTLQDDFTKDGRVQDHHVQRGEFLLKVDIIKSRLLMDG